MEPLAIDIREAGRLTSLSPRTIRRHIKAGHIRSVRIGTRLLIRVDSLRDWINRNSSDEIRRRQELSNDDEPANSTRGM